MISVPIVRGRKVNRLFCLLFLVLTLIFLVTSFAMTLLHRKDITSVFLILSAIMAGFSVFYGFSWLYWSRKEKTKSEALRAADQQKMHKDTGRITFREFTLPKESLTKSAFRRFQRIVRWTIVAVLAAFLLILGIQLLFGTLQGPLQLIWILLFCVLIAVPGLVVQWIIYKKYERSVPQRILLYPGKIVIDEKTFAVKDISEIRITSDYLYNQNSPAFNRKLLIQMGGSCVQYRLDYRTGMASSEQPFWKEYRQFHDSLSYWGEENDIPVIIEYMD